MGCDIHFHTEVFDGNEWQRAKEKLVDGPCGWKEDAYTYDGRNYDLFSILAGVRGAESPLSEPRGVPEDASSEVSKAYTDWDLDAHSASWFTLKELLEFDWSGRFSARERWVDSITYEAWDKKGYPPSSCGGAYGQGIVSYTREEYEALKAANEIEPSDRAYIIMSFDLTYGDTSESFQEMLQRCKELHSDHEKVRFVFWFDN